MTVPNGYTTDFTLNITAIATDGTESAQINDSIDITMGDIQILDNNDNIADFSSWSEPVKAYAMRGDDNVTGTNFNDEIYGERGHDTLYGGTGDDYIDGGAGEIYFTEMRVTIIYWVIKVRIFFTVEPGMII